MWKININKNSVFILIGLIIAFPGYYLGDNYISITDILIPIIWAFIVVKSGGIRKSRLNYTNKAFYGYVFICFISVCFACIFYGSFLISAFLKVLRLAECLMLAKIIKYIYSKWRCMPGEISISLYEYIIFWGSLAAATGIILFLTQSMIFHPTQLMEFNGIVMRRAEGVYGDAQSFSFAMSIVFVLSIVLFANKHNRVLCLISAILSFFAIVFSDTRVAFFAIVLSLIVLGFRKNFFRPKTIATVIICLVALIVLYNANGYFNRFINERIVKVIQAIFSFDFSAVSAISSHRIETWGIAFAKWNSNNFIQKLIGTGYKVSAEDMADNQFIYSLVTTGVIGCIFVLMYWIRLFIFTLRKRAKGYLFDSQLALVILSIIFCCLCDAMTLYRAMYVLTIMFTVFNIESVSNKLTR